MHRSNHLIDRSIASRILCASEDVVAMTSSSCMIMSEPMVFWRDIECSGVKSLEDVDQYFFTTLNDHTYIGVPSCGLRKRTPSSVTLANLRRLTI